MPPVSPFYISLFSHQSHHKVISNEHDFAVKVNLNPKLEPFTQLLLFCIAPRCFEP